jgi:hypothetical protein
VGSLTHRHSTARKRSSFAPSLAGSFASRFSRKSIETTREELSGLEAMDPANHVG